MHEQEVATGPASASMPVLMAADLQDHLIVASNDLERLQRLLDDASQALMGHFTDATAHIETALVQIEAAKLTDALSIRHARQTVASAITALQFQDMATQLIAHTTQRLRNCADRLARGAMGDEEDEGEAYVEEAPLRPNPVTQDEMDAGSVELF